MSDVEFRLLGPVEVREGGRPLPLGGPRGQSILAALLLDANRVVPVDQLIAAAWGDDPPSTARVQAQNRISQLRRTLGARNMAGTVATTSSGYRLHVNDGQLDLDRFRRLVADADAWYAGGDCGAALEVLAEALSLWRGPALSGLDTPPLVAAARRLEESRVLAQEKRIEIGLAAGRHAEFLPELATLIQAHPYRERLRECLMLALYRTGRQAEALQTFRETRAMLVEQLGLEPGPSLRRLHEAILRGDDRLAETSTTTGEAAQEPSTPADRSARVAATARHLPGDLAGFVGRADFLKRLDELPGDPTAVVICAIAGTAGIGKTTLAVHWAHRVASRFGDGQLYVDLRGFDPVAEPMDPTDALGGFLEALGVRPNQVPASLDRQVGLYRSLLAGRRVLVVLDNARDSEQVQPLLPGSPGCLAVVTSRNQLSDLVVTRAAEPLRLDLLSPAEARQLLARRLGPDRVAAEPAAVDEIIARCAGLPLALAIVAARAATYPDFPLRALAEQLRVTVGGLDGFAGGEASTDLRAVFSWSYRRLAPAAARLFRLLGMPAGPEIAGPAVASLAGVEPTPARSLLAELVRAELVTESTPGRYALHDLLRVYATELSQAHESEAERRAAQRRLLDHYVATAAAAMDRLHPADAHYRPRVLATTSVPDMSDPDTARAWLDTERGCLAAAVAYAAANGWPTHAVRLSTTLYRYLDGGHYTTALAIHGHALDAARRTGDLDGEAEVLVSLGVTERQLGRNGPAVEHLRQALTRFRQVGDRAGAARVHGNLGIIEFWLGHYRSAADHHQQALVCFRELGHRIGEARALSNLGTVHTRMGKPDRSAEHHLQALTLFREIGDRHGEAWSLSNLGAVTTRLGRYAQATGYLQQALLRHRQAGDRSGEAWALHNLGDVRTCLGRPDQAEEHHRQALTFFRDTDDRYGEILTLNGLGDAAYAADNLTDARAHYRAALAVEFAADVRHERARAHAGLGHVHHALGACTVAREHFRQALTLYTALSAAEAHEVQNHLTACEGAHG